MVLARHVVVVTVDGRVGQLKRRQPALGLRRQDHAWRKRLQPVQSLLGDLNDIETALRFVPASLTRAAPVREALHHQRIDTLAELAVPLALTVVMASNR